MRPGTFGDEPVFDLRQPVQVRSLARASVRHGKRGDGEEDVRTLLDEIVTADV